MPDKSITSTFIVLCLVALVSGPAVAGSMTTRAGVGYEFLSQEFFEDSLLQAGADSLDIVTSLKTTYLDDFRATLDWRFLPRDDRRLELDAKWEQTADYFRARAESRFRPRLGKSLIDGYAQLEWKQGYSDNADQADDYLSGSTRAKVMLPTSEHMKLWWQVRGDFIRFDSVADYSFNHFRLGAFGGITYEFANFSTLTANAFYQLRSVPDSGELDYRTLGAEVLYFGFYSRGDVDLFTRVESRSYDDIDDTDDYLRLEVDGRHRILLSDDLFSRQELAFEALRFSSPGLYNSNYNRLETNILVGVEHLPLSVALGPHLEWLSEDTDSTLTSEDYFEIGLLSNLDYSRIGQLFGSLESETGIRDVQESDITSDFVYERLSLLADWEVTAGLSLNLLLSAEWEWHDESSENNSILLVSSVLQYTF